MMKKVLLIFIYCFFINSLFAQPNLEWYATADAKYPYADWHFDDQNHMYYVGFFGENQDLDFHSNNEFYFIDSKTNKATKGFGIAQYDVNGKLSWVKGNTANFNFNILYTKLHGNTIYILGRFYGQPITPDFDRKNYWISADGGEDLVILQYDLNGKFKRFDKMYFSASIGYLTITNFVVENDGSLHIGGSSDGHINFDIKDRSAEYDVPYGKTAFYTFYSKDLDILNHFVLKNSDVGTSGFDIDKDKNIYLTGTFSGKLDLDPTSGEDLVETENVSGFLEINSFIVKIDKAGKYLWGKKLLFDQPKGIL